MNSVFQNIVELSHLISLAQIAHDAYTFSSNKMRAKTLHEKESNFSRKFQQEATNEIRRTYIMSSFNDMERHFQQLNSDLIQGSKEFEKDMVDQRTLWCQTIILAATIMILALIAVLIQGSLPNSHSTIVPPNKNIAFLLYMGYSISNAGSMVLLFLCVVIYVEIVHRVSEFNIERSRAHTANLKDAREKTEELLCRLRPPASQVEDQGPSLPPHLPTASNLSDNSLLNMSLNPLLNPSLDTCIGPRNPDDSSPISSLSSAITTSPRPVRSTVIPFLSKIPSFSLPSINSSTRLLAIDESKETLSDSEQEMKAVDVDSEDEYDPSDQLAPHRPYTLIPPNSSRRAPLSSNRTTNSLSSPSYMEPLLDHHYQQQQIPPYTNISTYGTSVNSLLPPIAPNSPFTPSSSSSSEAKRKIIANLPKDEVDREFQSHGREVIEEFMRARDLINMETADIYRPEKSFGNYWYRYCSDLDRMGVFLFYFGTSLMLVSVMIFMWANFTIVFSNEVSGNLAIFSLMIVLLISLVIRAFFRSRDKYKAESVERRIFH